MGYATNANTNYEGNNIPSLPIGIYDNATLVGGKLEKPVKDDGTVLTERITISFKTAEGQPYEKSELKPDESTADFESKSDNMTKRIGHILSKFYPKEQLVQANTSWEAYSAWALALLNNANKAQKVKFAIIGSVYDGKARTGFPNYPPFIVKAGADLSFDANALKGNAEYEAFQKPAVPDATPGVPNIKTAGEF